LGDEGVSRGIIGVNDLLNFAKGPVFLEVFVDEDLVKKYPELKNSRFLVEARELRPLEGTFEGLALISPAQAKNFKTMAKSNPGLLFLTDKTALGAGSDFLQVNFSDLNEVERVCSDAQKRSFLLTLERFRGEGLQLLMRFQREAKGFLEEVMREVRESFSPGHLSDDAQFFKEIITYIAKLKEEVYSLESEDELKRLLNQLGRRFGGVRSFDLVNDEQMFSDLAVVPREYHYLPLPDRGQFLRFVLEAKEGTRKYLLATLVYDVVCSFLDGRKLKEENPKDIQLWEEVFMALPLPIALVSDEGELLLHNSHFVTLGLLPKECLNLADQVQTEIAGRPYNVTRYRLESNVGLSWLFLFNTHGPNPLGDGKDRSLRGPSSKDLGIISSSLAHELNNPLAGILAGISLLETEDFWDQEQTQFLQEMRASAKRSKDLVEIFLGFGRATTAAGAEGKIGEAFSQAQSLLRFRMVESNIKIDMKVDHLGTFRRPVNMSVMAMIFYLILNEALTHFSHFSLVSSPKESGGRIIQASLVEREEVIELRFARGPGAMDGISKSKLVQNLADLEGITVVVDEGRILISEWTLT
jgi:hypothetical protein